ncbi:MAG: autotransporter-associated beta strand repeat-containing protein, partial [Verrucomicrobia bacterium]|nr:autotransporter-associated beta strand repeat-containing protein [Verrucomicrobiota bacterium]
VVVDGATITVSNSGFRLRASTNPNSATVSATLQNNGTLALLGTANFTVGASADTNLSTPALSNNFTLVSGSIAVSDGGYFIGSSVANAGTFTQLGGAVGFSASTNTNGVALANNTNTLGIYQLNGGTLTTARLLKAGTNDAFASFRFNGGTLKALSTAFSTDFIQGLNEVLVQAGGATVDSDTFDITINQALLTDAGSPGGGLVKQGAGRLALNATNTYTGTTVVSNGTLGGTGSYAGSVSVAAAGTIAPGNSIGTLTLASNLTLAGGTVMEINRTNAQTADLLAAGGAVTYGGTLTVSNLGPDLVSGDTFNLFDGASFAGTFSATNLPALTNGMTWDTSQLVVNGTITVVTPPPPVTTPAVIYTVVYGGSTVQLVGTGGPANALYRVMSETNMIIPYTNWVPVITNNFDAFGSFDTTFPVTPADLRRFYIIIFP